jgi:selenocysteine-specific elongation factor
LQVLRDGDPPARLEQILIGAGAQGLDFSGLQVRTALPARALARNLEILGARGAALCYDRERRAWVATATLERLAAKAALAVRAFHQTQPLAAGIPREELRSRLGIDDARLFAKLLPLLAARGITADAEHVGETGRKPGSADSERALRDDVEALLRRSGLMPPSVEEAARQVGDLPQRVLAVLKLLERERSAVRVSNELWFDAAAVEALGGRLIDFLLANEAISTQEFKELVGTSRKWAMPLGEYFDREKITLRVGDTKRILRGADGWRARRAGGAP